MEHLEAFGLKKSEFALAWLQAKKLYDVLQVARTWPKSSITGGPLLPKRYRCMPTATVSNLTAQELETMVLDLTVQDCEGCMLEQEDLLVCPIPHQGQYTCWDGTHVYQHKWHPAEVSLLDWGVHWETLTCATMCTHVCHAHLGMKLSCPFCPITFFNSNTLK